MKRLLPLILILYGCGESPPKPAPTSPPSSTPLTAPAATAPASVESLEPEDPPQRDLVSAVTINGVEAPQGFGDPGKAATPSSKLFKNAKLLGDVSGGRLMASMQSMRASLGADCDFCHKSDFSSDANGHKVISRKMMEMSFALNRDHFDNKVKVSCFTCHQGNKEPKLNPPPEKPSKELADADKKKPSGEYFKNVQLLKEMPAGELGPLMRRISAALGVGCEFCHVKGAFESDEKNQKKTARQMLKMVDELNKTYFAKKKTPAITCDTCHHGAAEPSVNVGPGLLVSVTVKEQTTWRALVGVAAWPTPPKTRKEMQTALGSMAPNQALGEMLLSGDTGALGHLPPGEYQLCGAALPEKGDALKDERPVTCQPLTIKDSPQEQTVKIELPAP